MDTNHIHPHDQLTERETEVLQMIATPMSTKEIAKQLYITRGTLRIHMKRIYAKLGVHSRLEAIAVAKRDELNTNNGYIVRGNNG